MEALRVILNVIRIKENLMEFNFIIEVNEIRYIIDKIIDHNSTYKFMSMNNTCYTNCIFNLFFMMFCIYFSYV